MGYPKRTLLGVLLRNKLDNEPALDNTRVSKRLYSQAKNPFNLSSSPYAD